VPASGGRASGAGAGTAYPEGTDADSPLLKRHRRYDDLLYRLAEALLDDSLGHFPECWAGAEAAAPRDLERLYASLLEEGISEARASAS
jgi:hypothetical protein